MKKTLAVAATMLMANAASAYEAGVFTCPNIAGLPDNVYRIEKVAVGADTLPYVHATRYFQMTLKGPVQKVEIKGMASVVESESGEELTVGAIYLKFDGGRLKNCAFKQLP